MRTIPPWQSVFKAVLLGITIPGIAMLACVVPQVADAQPIVYEGFDYYNADTPDTFPDPADGSLNGGNGWDGGWETDTGVPSEVQRIVENGLIYTDSNGDTLQKEGGEFEQHGNWGQETPIRTFDMSGVDPALVKIGTGSDKDFGKYGSSIWLTFVGKGIVDDDPGYSAAAFTFRTRSSGRKSLSIGRTWKLQLDGSRGEGDIGNESWGILRHKDGTPNDDVDIAAGVSSTDGSTIFMAIRLDFLGPFDQTTFGPGDWGTNISAWINPDLNSEPLATDPSNFADAINVWEFRFDRITMRGSADTFLDELRIGATYTDVAPIAVPVDLPGDFDFDADVDGADLLEWQRDASVGILADWQANFGTTAAVSAVKAVPEPASLLLACILAIAVAVGRSRTPGAKRGLFDSRG